MVSPPPVGLFHTGSPSHCAAAGAARTAATASVNTARLMDASFLNRERRRRRLYDPAGTRTQDLRIKSQSSETLFDGRSRKDKDFSTTRPERGGLNPPDDEPKVVGFPVGLGAWPRYAGCRAQTAPPVI